MVTFLKDGPPKAKATILLAHGAGAPMDSPFMDAIATLFADRGMAVARFEFDYMAARRHGGSKRPPPRAEKLVGEFTDAITSLAAKGPLIIGGKSMGGRVAALTAGQAGEAISVAGVACLGFPFHPPGRSDKLQTDAFSGVTVPILICQGTRDPFGSAEEVPDYTLPEQAEVFWVPDGNHDLVPRKSSGRSAEENWCATADAVSSWMRGL